MTMSHRANDPAAKQIRSLREIVAVLGGALSVFVIDLLTGFISHGIDLDHLSNTKHAAESAVAAALAGLGIGAAFAGKRAYDAQDATPAADPPDIVKDYPPDPNLPNP